MGNSKFNVSDASRLFVFSSSEGLKTWFELSRVKIYRNDLRGKQKLLRVSGRFELSRVRDTEGKITVNVWRKSRGNRFWFELARDSSKRGFKFELSGGNCTLCSRMPVVQNLNFCLTDRKAKEPFELRTDWFQATYLTSGAIRYKVLSRPCTRAPVPARILKWIKTVCSH